MPSCTQCVRPSFRVSAGDRVVFGLLALLLAPFAAPAQQPPPVPPARQEAESSAQRLHLMVGRSLVISSPGRLKRVSVADPAIADAVIVNPTQILINGKAPGGVSLVLWDESDQSTSFDLMVDMDILGISQKIRAAFPSEAVAVEASKDSIILTGKASSKAVADKIVEVISSITPKVITLMEVPQPPPPGEVMLEVRFAEVSRGALNQLAVNFFSTGSHSFGPRSTVGQTGTEQFGGTELRTLEVQSDGLLKSTEFRFQDLLNIFLFRADINLGATIRAMEQKNLLQILAEPNLITQTGKEASFLAGGEFPFPTLQAGTSGFQGITIIFKEFGVRLNFTPTLTERGKIHLKVRPEVSALDFANALTISGFLIPALSTRRVETQMELEDGQSFAIAGLVDDRLTETVQKIPFVGDIPILGKLFTSHSKSKSRNELLVLVTARLVKPGAPLPAGPQFIKPFMPPATPEKPGAVKEKQ